MVVAASVMNNIKPVNTEGTLVCAATKEVEARNIGTFQFVEW